MVVDFGPSSGASLVPFTVPRDCMSQVPGSWAPAEAACDLVGVTRRGLHAVFAVFLSIADSNFGV